MDKYQEYFNDEECQTILGFLGVKAIGTTLSHDIFTSTVDDFVAKMCEVYEKFGEDPYQNSPEQNLDTIMIVIDAMGVDKWNSK